MIWLKRLLRHPKQAPPCVERTKSAQNGSGDEEILEQLERAKVALDTAHQRRAEFEKVSNSLTRLNIRNHFGESIEIAMRHRERHA